MQEASGRPLSQLAARAVAGGRLAADMHSVRRRPMRAYRQRLQLLIAGVSLSTGCGQSPPTPIAPVAVRCVVPSVGSPAHPWREVTTPGFTFCVPPEWRPVDGRPVVSAQAWSVGHDTVALWPAPAPARGLLPPEYAGLNLADLRTSIIPHALAPENRPLGERATRLPSCFTIGEVDTLQGRRVELGRTFCGLRYHTMAFWPAENVRFAGTASSVAAARVQWMMYRTVRFAEGPPPN